MADVMKLGMVLSATDKMSRIVEQATKKSTKAMTDFQKRVNVIGGKIQKIGAGMTAAGGAITGALFADVASMAAKAKQIEFSAQKVGMSAENFQKYSGFAEKMGVEVSGLEMALGRLSKAQILAATGNKAAAKIFKMTSISIYDQNGKLKNSSSILSELSDKFKVAPDGPKKTALAMMLFGKSGKDMIPMLNQGSTAMKAWGDKMQQYGVVLTKEQLIQFKKYRTAMGENKMAILGVKTTIAVSVLPVVIKYAQKIADISKRIIGWTQNHRSLTKTIVVIAGATGLLLTILGTFLITAGTVIRSVGLMIKIWNAAKFAVFVLRFGIFNIISTMKTFAIWQKIAAAAQWLWNVALSANPIGIVVIAIGALIAGIVIAWKKFAGFRAVIKTTWEVIKGFGGILKDFVIDRIKGIISGLGAMGKAIALLFKGKFAAAGQVAVQGVKDLSGYTAVQTMVKHSVELTKSVPATYSRIYAREKTAEKPQSQVATAMRNQIIPTANVQRTNMSHASTVNYSPTIHVNGGFPTVKQDLTKILNTHKDEILRFLKQLNQNQNRLSFT